MSKFKETLERSKVKVDSPVKYSTFFGPTYDIRSVHFIALLNGIADPNVYINSLINNMDDEMSIMDRCEYEALINQLIYEEMAKLSVDKDLLADKVLYAFEWMKKEYAIAILE